MSPVPGNLYRFGSALVFSPDSNSLAVAETGTGIVRMYKNVSGTAWSTQPGSVLNIPVSTKVEVLSPSIAFSPDGQTLAIGDSTITVNAVLGAGTVQLFSKKTDGSWDTMVQPFLIQSKLEPVFSLDNSLLLVLMVILLRLER